MATKSIFRNIIIDKQDFDNAKNSSTKSEYSYQSAKEMTKVDMTSLLKKILKG